MSAADFYALDQISFKSMVAKEWWQSFQMHSLFNLLQNNAGFNSLTHDPYFYNPEKKNPFENIVEKGENAGYQHFLLYPQRFQKPSVSGSLKVGIVW